MVQQGKVSMLLYILMQVNQSRRSISFHFLFYLIKITFTQNDIHLILEYGVQHFIFMFDIPISFQKKKK
jgi:hypothetical protein